MSYWGYHSTSADKPEIHRGLCITTDIDASIRYLSCERLDGTCWTVEIDSNEIADESDLLAAAGYESRDDAEDHGYQVFELADMPQILDRLAADGWAAVRYTDDAYWDTHETVRVIDTSVAEIGRLAQTYTYTADED